MSWKYRGDDFVRTTKLEIRINEGQWHYLEQLMADGLWGNTIEECVGLLINRALLEQLDKGRIRLVRVPLRGD